MKENTDTLYSLLNQVIDKIVEDIYNIIDKMCDYIRMRITPFKHR